MLLNALRPFLMDVFRLNVRFTKGHDRVLQVVEYVD